MKQEKKKKRRKKKKRKKEEKRERKNTFKVVISLATSKPNQHWSLHRLTCVVPLY